MSALRACCNAARVWPLLLLVASMAYAATPPCAETGVMFSEPNLATVPNGAYVADASTCQATCRDVPACMQFTWFHKDGACWLHEASAMPVAVADATSGPKDCSTPLVFAHSKPAPLDSHTLASDAAAVAHASEPAPLGSTAASLPENTPASVESAAGTPISVSSATKAPTAAATLGTEAVPEAVASVATPAPAVVTTATSEIEAVPSAPAVTQAAPGPDAPKGAAGAGTAPAPVVGATAAPKVAAVHEPAVANAATSGAEAAPIAHAETQVASAPSIVAAPSEAPQEMDAPAAATPEPPAPSTEKPPTGANAAQAPVAGASTGSKDVVIPPEGQAAKTPAPQAAAAVPEITPQPSAMPTAVPRTTPVSITAPASEPSREANSNVGEGSSVGLGPATTANISDASNAGDTSNTSNITTDKVMPAAGLSPPIVVMIVLEVLVVIGIGVAFALCPKKARDRRPSTRGAPLATAGSNGSTEEDPEEGDSEKPHVKNTFLHYDVRSSSSLDFEEPQFVTAPAIVQENSFHTRNPSMVELHERGECRPCAYFAYKKDGCRMGDKCEFCHICTREEIKRRKKEKQKQNKVMGGLPEQTAVAEPVSLAPQGFAMGYPGAYSATGMAMNPAMPMPAMQGFASMPMAPSTTVFASSVPPAYAPMYAAQPLLAQQAAQ